MYVPGFVLAHFHFKRQLHCAIPNPLMVAACNMHPQHLHATQTNNALSTQQQQQQQVEHLPAY